MSPRRYVAGVAVATMMLLASAVLTLQGQSAPASPPAPAGPTSSSLSADDERQLLTRYCAGCHSERARASGMDSARKLAVDALDPHDVARDARMWELVVRKLRAGMMPPPGVPRPDAATLESMIAFLEGELDRTATPHMPPPGLHRLNRTEYANAIRDILNLPIDPAAYLPSDDSTSGFDNIAGALGLSSTLVEAYVTAAQKISRLALGYPQDPTLVVYRTREDTTQDYHIEGLPFGTRGGLLVNHTFPSDGEYTITVTPIFGDNMSPAGFGSVPCERLEILMDGQRLGLINWQGGGRTLPGACDRVRGVQGEASPDEPIFNPPTGQAGPEAFFGGRGGTPMRVRVRVGAGPHAVGATFLATNFAPLLDLDRRFMRSTVQTGPTPGYTFFPHVGTIRIEGPYSAARPTDSPSRRKIFVCKPAAASEEEACARRIATNLATAAFRRTASKADVDLLMEFYRFGRREKDFEQGVEMMLARLLASPQFLYRIEEEPAGLRPSQPYRVDDVDLASRLSFFLWSTVPDAELLALASKGRLREPQMLEQQVRRMLRHPKAEALAANFAGQWLNLRGLDAAAPLPLVYPDFDDPLRQAMRREVELLFDAIVRNDRPITELLSADYTFVNERLARHYGIPHVYGSQFRRVTLGPALANRHGLLGKGAFLVTTSKPERTSPVTRGKWIMSNLLGMSPPDPPPDVPALPPRAADPNASEPSMRQKMLDHRVRPDCVQCHRLMDPIGFALEPFDGIGLVRSHDEGTPIDAKGVLFDTSAVDGPESLRTWLVSRYSNQFVAVAAEKLLTYALGRGLDYRDMPLVRAIARQAGREDARFSALVLAIVKSDPFQMNVKTEDAGSLQQAAGRGSGSTQ